MCLTLEFHKIRETAVGGMSMFIVLCLVGWARRGEWLDMFFTTALAFSSISVRHANNQGKRTEGRTFFGVRAHKTCLSLVFATLSEHELYYPLAAG